MTLLNVKAILVSRPGRFDIKIKDKKPKKERIRSHRKITPLERKFIVYLRYENDPLLQTPTRTLADVALETGIH
jgi:hypothetical protein